MNTARSHGADPALMSLEAAAASARSGFACLFSTSDEYETALITERRAQGRYSDAEKPLAAGAVRRLQPDGREHRAVLQLKSVCDNRRAGAPQALFCFGAGRVRHALSLQKAYPR